MNDGLFVRWGALATLLGRAGVIRGLQMKLRITITLKIDVAVCRYALAVIVFLLS
jgi:hypothetical protein